MDENKTCENCEKTSAVLTTELGGLKELLLSKFDGLGGTVARIEEQTTRTNGRVSSLEKWRAYITGAIAIAGFAIIYLYSK